MKQLARVEKRIDHGHVLICVVRQGACGGNCASCSACSSQPILAEAADPLGVSPGERVIVSSSSAQILGLSVVLYLVPLVTFFLFYALGTLFLVSELHQALFGILGFFLGLLVPFFTSRRLKGKIPLVVLERVPPEIGGEGF